MVVRPFPDLPNRRYCDNDDDGDDDLLLLWPTWAKRPSSILADEDDIMVIKVTVRTPALLEPSMTMRAASAGCIQPAISCSNTHTHTHPPPPFSSSPVAMEPVAKAERYVVVMEVKATTTMTMMAVKMITVVGQTAPSLNYKGRPAMKQCIAALCSLQRGWKERRVILRNANRPFPHRKTNHSPRLPFAPRVRCLFKHFISRHVELRSCLVRNSPLSSPHPK